MTFDSVETSLEGGSPLDLYTFTSTAFTYRITPGEDAITVDSVDYSPAAISSNSVGISDRVDDQNVVVTLPISHPLAQQFRGIPKSQRVTLTLRQVHRGDGNPVLRYKGVVRQVTFQNDAKEAKITTSPAIAAFTRSFPNQTYSSLCPLMLFSTACGVLEGDFEETVTVASSTENTITVTGATNVGVADDYWEVGVAEYNSEKRLITKQVENVFTLLVPFSDAPDGQTIRILPGCKKRMDEDCNVKFSNAENHQGWTYIPTKNPHETGLI